jgi:serine/threonine protein kinase
LAPPAHEIGSYIVLDVVRSDAAGDVFRAYDRRLRQEVVIVLLADARTAAKNAEAFAKLSHPRVAAVHEIGEHEGRPFIAMDAIDGPTFDTWATKPRPWRDVLGVVLAAGEGLAAVHTAGIVHGAFDATSVVVGKSEDVHITGLGIGSGDATVRDDLHAFAVVAWAAIYGKPPFAGSSRELARVDEARAPSWVHRALVRALSATPTDRQRDMPELLAELGRDAKRGKSLRIAGVVAAIAATAGGVAGTRAWIQHGRIEACEEDGALIDALWNDTARDDLATSILQSGAVDPHTLATRTTMWLDDFATRWRDARTQVCVAREIDMTVGPEAYAGTMSCLERRHLALEALLAELARADANAAYRAIDAAAGLRSPTDCGSPGHRDPAHPDDVPIEPVREVRTALARTTALLAIGKAPDARELASTAVQQAIALDWPPLVADARLQLCVAEQTEQNTLPAHAACEQAYFDAARARRADVMVDAAIRLVGIAGAELEHEDEARQWALHAEAALALVQDPDERRLARLLDARAAVHGRADRLVEARALLEQSLAIVERDLGTHPVVVAASTRLAVLLETLDERAAARDMHARAAAVAADVYGPEHPFAAQARRHAE